MGKGKLPKISEEEYKKRFGITNKPSKAQLKKIERAYNRAWEAKNFEIDNYWKRANYSWAFQAASFAAYFAVVSSEGLREQHQISYIVICIGLVTAFAWVLINKGSKTWQRNWEIHVDMLENYITGPLYKTITTDKTFSVSKINEIVSFLFVFIWLVLGFRYCRVHITFDLNKSIAWEFILSSLGVVMSLRSMYFGYGRGRFGERKVRFYKRAFKIK